MNRSDLPEIKQGLKDRILDLCRWLLPDGEVRGRFWVAHNPVTMDHSQSPEFKVPLNRDIGAWIDWRTGEKGDVLGLVAYCQQTDIRGALAWSRDFLGLSRMSHADRQRMSARAEEARRDAEENRERQRIARMQKAEQRFLKGWQDGARSVAETMARRYFAARGIPLEQWAERDLATMRFADAAGYWPRGQFRKDERGRLVVVKAAPEFPAVISAMRLPAGQVAAVHYTFLDPLGPRKLPVGPKENAKLMWGEAKGAMIRLTHGPEGEPPETARQAHPLLLGEGIETTATMAMVTPEARAWAAGSLDNMANAPVWLDCISSVLLLKDHFKHPTTERQFAKVCDAMERSGKPWAVMESIAGNDFNDMVNDGDEA